jgi:hypothetical protein
LLAKLLEINKIKYVTVFFLGIWNKTAMERRGRYFVHRGGTYSERSEGKLRRI